MAQPPPSMLPSTQPAFSGIDAAVASIIENNPSCNADIIGTAVSLSTVTMDRIESMMQKLRGRGKRLPKSKHPLTVDRPFARAQSPPPKTAVSPVYPTARSISPEPRTALIASPISPASRRQSISNINIPSTRTGRQVTPRPSDPNLVTAYSDPARTGRGVSPTPRSSGYPTAISPAPPLSPASRRQSISNVHLPSTRTGREITPRPSDANLAQSEPVRTGRGVSPTPRSSGYPTAISPGVPSARISKPQADPSQRSTRTAREASQRSTRTGRGVSPTPRSSGYPTAISPAPPLSPASRRQSISNVHLPSTRTGRELTPPPRQQLLVAHGISDKSTRTGREASPPPLSADYKTAVSPATGRVAKTQADASQRSARTGRAVSPAPRSSGYPTAISPATPPPPASRRQSISNVNIPSTRTGRQVTPRPSNARLGEGPPSVTGDDGSAKEPSLHTGHPCSPPSNKAKKSPAEQWAHVKPGSGPKICPAKSPVLSTAREIKPHSERSKREIKPQSSEIWKDLVKAAEKQNVPSGVTSPGMPETQASQRSIRTGRGVSPTPRSSGYPTAISPAPPLSPASRRQSISNVHLPSTRTGREITPRPSDANLVTAHSDPARIGRGVSPTPRSSGYPTAISPASPLSAASRRQSISNVHLPSTRTGREITPRPSDANLVTAHSDPVARTGRGVSPTPQSSGYPTAISPGVKPQADVSQQSVRTGRGVSPTTGYLATPASRRQSISNVNIPSTRTGREVTPRPSESRLVTARSDPARTGRGASPTPRSSGYPTAVSPGAPSARQSNVHQPSAKTGREATPPHSFRQQPSVAAGVPDKSTRTGRETSPLLPPTMNPQLITRTTVVPTNEIGEDGSPGVMLFVHSFYVFSMTLNAWANHLSNQSPAQ